jgi:Flp pilus assembly protein TadD
MNEAEFTLFFLASVLCYLRWREGNGARRWLVLSLAAGALSLLSKETAIMLCPMVFFYEWKRQRRAPQSAAGPPAAERPAGSQPPAARWTLPLRRAAWTALPFAALTGVYLAARFAALRGLSKVAAQASRATLLLTLPEVCWFYLRKLIWPLPMSLYYPLRFVSRPGFANIAWPLIASLGVLAGLWLWSRRDPAAGTASAWLLLPLAPPLLAMARFRFYDLVHDRYLYLPSVGLAMLAALAIRRVRPRGNQIAGVPAAQLVVLLAVVCLLGGIALRQERYWSGDQALYHHGLEVAPHNPLALTQTTKVMLNEEHNVPGALKLSEQALVEDPDGYQALVYGGVMRRNVHDDDGALALLLRASRLYPTRPFPWYQLGVIYFLRSQFGDAEAAIRRAIELAPEQPDQHLLLGSVLERENRLAEARSEYQAELRVYPGSVARQALAALDRRISPPGPPNGPAAGAPNAPPARF